MRILHICNDYRDKNLYEKMFIELNNNDCIQDVFVPYKEKINLTHKDEYNIVQSKCYNNIDRIFYSRKVNKIYKNCLENIDINKIDIIHAHTLFSTGGVAYKLKKFNNVEYIVSVRGTDINIFFKKMRHLRKQGMNILLNAKKIIFVSKSIQNNLLSLIKEDTKINEIKRKSVVITNGIEDTWFNENTRKKYIDNEVNIVQTGWINSNKNQLTTIKAIESLNDLGISCNLTIIGGVEKDKDEKYLKKLLNHINMSKYKQKFKLVGKKNKEEIIKIYRNKHIFILPSRYETFGLVYIEALTQGLPIIYSKGQGVDGLFTDGDVGYNVNSLSQLDIVNSVKRLIDNYDQIQMNVSKNIDRFKWSNICKKIKKLYLD